MANSDTTLLKRFLEWLNCINRHIQVSAALAIGNYARSGKKPLLVLIVGLPVCDVLLFIVVVAVYCCGCVFYFGRVFSF